ncbi:phosphatidylserine decarboxylase [Fodinibius roseus]|uniref:Phosphatidylserine decarboxylase proenzyme n=1 Tax=Fodinibius roseus TaxID=1194090 RepID=A0A1M4SY08_9BACT|nr:phosphatidylserine decarboxylase family protein [Fodinibius roseus]SHE36857.1 phosphatidylserine decarboxylase [Fodinibius roseus]
MFAREGYSNIFATVLFALLVSLGAYYLNHWVSHIIYGVMALLVLFILYFFRDPDRDITPGENLVLSPADGNIVLVEEVEEGEYIKEAAIQISIFLSPLDVHVNRLPVSGRLEYLEYHPGVYLMAWDHRASSMNERADFGIRHKSGMKIFFRQITGFLARRIVYHIQKGDELTAGERFGMMKFGSRMDILVPADVEINVSKGEKAVAGKTILATINS